MSSVTCLYEVSNYTDTDFSAQTVRTDGIWYTVSSYYLIWVLVYNNLCARHVQKPPQNEIGNAMVIKFGDNILNEIPFSIDRMLEFRHLFLPVLIAEENNEQTLK